MPQAPGLQGDSDSGSDLDSDLDSDSESDSASDTDPHGASALGRLKLIRQQHFSDLHALSRHRQSESASADLGS